MSPRKFSSAPRLKVDHYIGQNPDRYSLCPAKAGSADGGMAGVGEGTRDFAAIFSEANVQHYFVEDDNPDDPVQSIETGHRTVDARSQLRAAAHCRVSLIRARAVKRSDTEYQQRLSLFRS